MKKLILILLLVPLFSMAQSVFTVHPRNGNLLFNFDLSSVSGTDTSFMFKFFDNQTGDIVDGWSIQAKWINVDTTGTIYLKTTNFEKQDFIYYNDSLRVSITGSSGSSGAEDAMWNWRYGQVFITMADTVENAGARLWLNITYSPK